MPNTTTILILGILLFSCNQPSSTKKQEDTQEKNSTAIGCSPELSDKSWYSSGTKAPLFKGLEGIHFAITTRNEEAQKYFDQGLLLSFAFNHA